jgi:hypothetical protein
MPWRLSDGEGLAAAEGELLKRWHIGHLYHRPHGLVTSGQYQRFLHGGSGGEVLQPMIRGVIEGHGKLVSFGGLMQGRYAVDVTR